MEQYRTEQKESYNNILNEVQTARTWEELNTYLRIPDQGSFAKTRATIIQKIRDRLFRIEKDRPSLSFGTALIDDGLNGESSKVGLPVIEVVKKETDAIIDYREI